MLLCTLLGSGRVKEDSSRMYRNQTAQGRKALLVTMFRMTRWALSVVTLSQQAVQVQG